jgi:arylsulfatase B
VSRSPDQGTRTPLLPLAAFAPSRLRGFLLTYRRSLRSLEGASPFNPCSGAGDVSGTHGQPHAGLPARTARWLLPLLFACGRGGAEPTVTSLRIEPEPLHPNDRPTCVADGLTDPTLATWVWLRDEAVVQTGADPRWPADQPLEPRDRLMCRLRLGDKTVAEARAIVRRPVTSSPPPNILILLADDVGVDQLRSFGANNKAPPTPQLDALASQGMRFTRAYANSICSPTRATVLTGRYSRRSGVGTGITLSSQELDLSPDELLLPELLRSSPVGPWDSSMLGKWHLTSNATAARRAPLDQGFAWFAGSPGNLSDENTRGDVSQGYFRWQKVTNGEIAWVERYATTETIDDTLDRARVMQEPWLMYVALNAAHAPLHSPPADLRQPGPPPQTNLEKYQAAVSAMDAEIGRLLRDLPADVRARTVIFFLGDNGSPEEGVLPANHPERSKGTMFEGGVHVPLLVLGPGVPAGATSEALVNSTDLFATIAELAQVPLPLTRPDGAPVQLDSTSLVPYFDDPATPSLRRYAYVEQFAPPACALGACRNDRRALIGARYKMLYDAVEQTWRLFDLVKDPDEGRNLLKAEPRESRLTADVMRAELVRLEAALQEDRTR